VACYLPRTQLPLRGQRWNNRLSMVGRGLTSFPFQPINKSSQDTWNRCVLYGLNWWASRICWRVLTMC